MAWDLHARMADEQRELQRRWASVAQGDAAGLAERAAAAFADHEPAWHGSAYHSVDIQIAAADVDAIRRGDFLIVLGDFHGGDNPLGQGLFARRHPQPGAIAARTASEIGPRVGLLPPRRGPVDMTARMFPVYAAGDVLVVFGEEPTPPGTRAVRIAEVVLTDGAVADRHGTFRLRLADLLFLPIFISAVRTFDPAGAPLERKPMLVDFQRPALGRVLRRWSAATARQAPGTRMELTEMLPGRGPVLAGGRGRPPHERAATRRRRPHAARRSLTPLLAGHHVARPTRFESGADLRATGKHARLRSVFRADRVQFDPVNEGVLVDRPGVRGAVAKGFAVGLAGSLDVFLGDRRERDKLDGVDFDETGADPVAAALLDLWPLPQPNRQRDISGQDVITQLAAELHTADGSR